MNRPTRTDIQSERKYLYKYTNINPERKTVPTRQRLLGIDLFIIIYLLINKEKFKKLSKYNVVTKLV